MKRFVIPKLAVILLFVLAACVPVQQATLTFLNAVGAGDDAAILILESSAVVFVPHGPTEGVALLIEGTNLTSVDERCSATDDGVGCLLGDVSEPTRVGFESDGNRTASVSYIRGDDIKFMIVTEPVQ